MEQKKNNAPIQINDFKIIWRIISRNWYIPIFIVPVFYLIGYFYSYKLENVYQASIELLKSNDTYYKSSLITDNSFYSTSRSYVDNSNEIRIITSYDIMKETVDKLKGQLQVSYYIVGRVRTTEQFSGSPFQVQINTLNPNFYEQPFNFKIRDFDEYELKYLSNGTETVKVGKFNQPLVDVDFNLTISREGSFIKSAADQFSQLNYQFIVHHLNSLVNQYKSALKVNNPDYTNVLVLTMDDIIPERATLILDTLSKVYINKSLNSRFEINERTINYIEKQLSDVSLSLNDIEDTMQNFKQQYNILDLNWEREDFFRKLAIYDGQKSSLKLKIDAINDLEKYIIEDKDPEFLPPNIYLVEGDEFMKKSIDELYSLQMDVNKQLSFSKEINPKIIELRQNIKKLKQNILVYLNNARNATYKIIENVSSEISSYVSDIKSIPPKQREMLNISRKVAVNEQLYNFLLQQRANTKIARASIVPEIKVIDSPRNMGVISTDKKKILSTFSAIGLAVSLLIIVLRVLFFSTIETVEELKESTTLPVIGDLPYQKGVSNLGFVVEESPTSYIAEAFRTLRTNLQYVILNSNKKTILLTSNAPGEGKTFTTINIGAILAKSGKKVVMLELDLHKPRIQKALEMNADIGISTFMVGQNELTEIVKSTVIPNLYAMLSGPIPPNPSDLVLSERLKELMEYAKANFDFVLIDTPPLGMLSDAAYLMQYADINLFVMNTKFATKSVLNQFQKLVNDNSIKDVYLVLNGVKRKRSRYYYSRYGYGYGYSYGYGYGYNKRG